MFLANRYYDAKILLYLTDSKFRLSYYISNIPRSRSIPIFTVSMSTNISLSFLVITGVFFGFKSASAHNLVSIGANLVANNTLAAPFSGFNSLPHPDRKNAPSSQIDRSNRQDSTKINSDDDGSLTTDPQRSLPSVNVVKANNPQTSIFSSDVAKLDRYQDRISAMPAVQSELSVEIPVPPPRTQIIKVLSVPHLPQIVKTRGIPSVVAMPNLHLSPADTAKVNANTYANNGANSNSELIYPLMNPAPVTSRFGWRTHPLTGSRRFHSGIDIGAPSGAPVVATGSGVVVSAGWNGGYGKAVIIQHNDTQQTLYGHLSEISVQPGQAIAQGTVIGLVGSTGNSTGPHLHFESRVPGGNGWVAIDPSQEIQYAVENLRRSAPFAQKDLPPGL
jgi:murein DD-endopeptidase MepM/ murein hydrolase activator NlpD